VPAWRRWLPYIVAAVLITGGAAIPIAIEIASTSYSGPNPEKLIALGAGLALAIVSALFLVFMMAGIYETAVLAMGTLSRPGLRVRGLVLDDMVAVTLLTDYEVVVAIVRVFWPRLIWISLLGAGLTWMWLEYSLGWNFVNGKYEPFLGAASFGPVTIGAIAFSGAVAGLIYVLWLLCAGHGLVNSLLASAAGLVVALAHLVAVPLAVSISVWIAVELSMSGDFHGPNNSSQLIAPAMALALIVGFALALYLSERWPSIRPFVLVAAPLLIPMGTIAIGLLQAVIPVIGSTEQLAFEYFMSWRAFSLANAVVGLPPGCYGSWSTNAMSSASLEWYRYPLLITMQVVLAAIALQFARRAVRLRRGNLA
jgi:hypothetical protein